MSTLLQALIANESGGRNIPNTTQGTSSGQAQGYFQITTGTWKDFGGLQYAPTALQATPEQQAAVAARIPLRRWAESTIARMRQTGRTIDVNKTLGENLAMNGETFVGFARDAEGGGNYTPTKRHVGGAGSSAANFSNPYAAPVGADASGAAVAEQTPAQVTGDALGEIAAAQYNPYGSLGATLADAVGKSKSQLQTSELSAPPPQVHAPRNIDIPLPQRAPDAPVLTDLASLFKVAPVGQPTAVDSKTGRPIMRRGYG